jgi:hypothetical protein
MDIANKQSRAMAQFQAFRTSPPSSWDESAVSKFHEIVSALEEAFEMDLYAFRIPEAELKQYEDESGSTAWVDAGRHIGRTPYPGHFPAGKQMLEKRCCDENLAKQKIDGIALYFQYLSSAPERQNKHIGF